MATMGDATIPFRSRVEPGENMFVVPVKRKFADDRNLRFGFESITLMPEYQNTQAFAYKLDSKEELETPVSYDLQLEIHYKSNYFSKEIPGKVWSYLSSLTKMADVISSVNTHYHTNKPAGTFYPPIIIDWLHLLAYDEDTTLQMFIEAEAKDLYGEEYNAAKHATAMPPSVKNREEFNQCIFPTSIDPDVLDGIRLRLWVAPNTTITFSNKNMPLALGFQESQLPPRNKVGQVPFMNNSTTDYKLFFAHDMPAINVSTSGLRGTKINCYLTKNVVHSDMVSLNTTKQREREVTTLFEDYAKTFETLGKSVNVYLSLLFDEATQTFSFKYPNNPNVMIRIYVPPIVMHQLGFDSSSGEYIKQIDVGKPVVTQVDTSELDKKALALVYDTGMIAVDLDEQSSTLSSHSGNLLMATLHPKMDGTLQNRIYFGELPRVHVSSNNRDLKFLLYRFNDYNEKNKLGWPVGAYVFGTLTGKV